MVGAAPEGGISDMLGYEDKEEWTGTYKPSGQIDSAHGDAENCEPVTTLGAGSVRGLTGRASRLIHPRRFG